MKELKRPQIRAVGNAFDPAHSKHLLPPRDDGYETKDLPAQLRQRSMQKNLGVDRDESVEAPRQLGKFRIIRRLGSGGLGQVYLAHDELLDRDVAIKILAPRFALDPACSERFLHEGRLAAKFDHRYIVRIFEALAVDGQFVIAMEYLKGGDVQQQMRKAAGRLPPLRSLKIITCMAEALVAASEQRIVHRDIKPANILLSEDGVPKLADLGIAHQVIVAEEPGEASPGPRVTAADSTVGTPGFMAPEQLRSSDVDVRADIYALGASYFNMVTGRVPNRAAAKREALRDALLTWRVRGRAEYLNPWTAANLEHIVMKMMQTDRVDRYQTPQEVLKALRRACSPLAMLGRRRKRGTVAAGLLAVLCLALGAALWARQSSPDALVTDTKTINLPAAPDQQLTAFEQAVRETMDPWSTPPRMLRLEQPDCADWPAPLNGFEVGHLLTTIVSLNCFLPLERQHFDLISEELALAGSPLSREVLERPRPGSLMPASVLVTLPPPLIVGDATELMIHCTDVGSSIIRLAPTVPCGSEMTLTELYNAVARAIVDGLRSQAARGRISARSEASIEIDLGRLDGLLNGDAVRIYDTIKAVRPSEIGSPVATAHVSRLFDFYAHITLDNPQLMVSEGMLVERPGLQPEE